MASDIFRLQIGCCLTFMLLVGCEQSSTSTSSESSSPNSNTIALLSSNKVSPDDASSRQPGDSLELVDWAPVKNTDGATIASVLTVRLPIPPELIGPINTYEPPRGNLSTSEYWMQANLVAEIGAVEHQSRGRSLYPSLLEWTHFEATFTVPERVTNQELKTGEHTLKLSKQRLATVQSELRCSYEILNEHNRTTITVRTSHRVSIEAVTVGRFISDRSNVNSLGYFHGNIDPSASKQERNIMLKLTGIDEWIPLKRQLPFVNESSGQNEE